DARGAGMRAPRLGPERDHRGGRCGAGDLHPPVPAGDRPQVDGHRLWWREGPQPAAGHGGGGDGRRDPACAVRDPPHGAGGDQRSLRADARRQVDPLGGALLKGDGLMERIEHRACFGGWQDVYRHRSAVLGCDMTFAIYLPPQAQDGPVPVLYWLSGLTCTEQNFITKAGAQRYAAEHGIAIVCPDTSPRGDDVADADGYDLGKGAGFYVNATQVP